MVGLVVMAPVDQMPARLCLNHVKPSDVLLLGSLGVIFDAAIGRDCHDEVLRFVVNDTPESAFLQSAIRILNKMGLLRMRIKVGLLPSRKG